MGGAAANRGKGAGGTRGRSRARADGSRPACRWLSRAARITPLAVALIVARPAIAQDQANEAPTTTTLSTGQDVAPPADGSPACPMVDADGAPLGTPVTVTHVDAADQVRLADGRVLRIAHIAAARDPLAGPRPDPSTEARGRAALDRMIAAARETRFLPLDGAPPDRHGRAIGRLILVSAAGANDAAEMLVRQGGARFWPAVPVSTKATPGPSPCALAVRAAEGEARAARRGAFADAAFAAHDATAPDLAASTGAMIAVEGRVASLGQAGRTTYVNFGDQFARDFTAWLSDKDRAAWLKTGVDVATWRGKWVRLRGVVGARDGGSMRLVDPSQAEVIAPPVSPKAEDPR